MNDLSLGIVEVERPHFDVVGIFKSGRSDSVKQWTADIWRMVTEKFFDVSGLIKREGREISNIWGLRKNNNDTWRTWDKEGGLYMVSFEMKDALSAVPAGWFKWQVPAFKYVVATTTKQTYDEVYEYMLRMHLVAKGYNLLAGPFDCYKSMNPDGLVDLYFPIAKL
jgi:predicted transcriptional regulator YdeE